MGLADGVHDVLLHWFFLGSSSPFDALESDARARHRGKTEELRARPIQDVGDKLGRIRPHFDEAYVLAEQACVTIH